MDDILMEFIAHIRQSDNQFQTVEQHLLEVKGLAECFGDKIGIKRITGLAGMLHDMGKFTQEFQDYILKAVNNPDNPPKRGSVDHSTAGGRLLFELFHKPEQPFASILSEVVGNAIISHHSYLHDFLNPELESIFLKRVKDKEIENYEFAKHHFFNRVISEKDFFQYVKKATTELETFLRRNVSEGIETNIMFLTKFVFSTLIDADRTNTRVFEENTSYKVDSDATILFKQYYSKLMNKIESFKKDADAENPIQRLRQEMSEQCEAFANHPSNIYTLSIPTGGGKTLASLRYALKHAINYKKKRIIYVVPFTTIIEQNAEEVRKILQDDLNILEHHSNVVEDEADDEYLDGFINVQQKLILAKDNWDIPIIFTTMVQFLNTFYAYGSRNIRRLHHLSESIIIFDEVQKVPVSSVSLFNKALNFLNNYCHTSIILCTATQPALNFVRNKLNIAENGEIVTNLSSIIEAFKRVEIVDLATEKKFDTLSLSHFIQTQLATVQNVMIVLNTKSVVKKLYELLQMQVDIPVYHLSTSMCAQHRKNILEEIRGKLNNGEKLICVSTQLIEAGVDISFDCVIRSLAGLDSIAQAAGRCNRHGKKKIGYVYVIDHKEENLSKLKEIKIGKDVAARILKDIKNNPQLHGGNILSTEAMTKYFQEFYYALEVDLDYPIQKLSKSMMNLLTDSKDAPTSYHHGYKAKYKEDLPLFVTNSYRTAAEHFEVISNHTTSVLVPYGEGKDIIAELNGNGTIEELSRLLKKAQQYTVNIYNNEFEQLIKNNGIVSFFDGKIFALKEGAYSGEFGIDLNNDSTFDDLIF
jgi:CRISPR-associated endonuclease/helicase Cas3